jgi:hypothetical protein
VIANGDAPEQFGTCANIDAVADDWSTWIIDSGKPNDHAVSDTTVVPEAGIAADDDSSEMINHEVAADHNLARQFDSGHDLYALVGKAIDQPETLAKNGMRQRVSPPAESVHDQRPEALGAPIAAMGNQIGSDVFEHGLRSPRGPGAQPSLKGKAPHRSQMPRTVLDVAQSTVSHQRLNAHEDERDRGQKKMRDAAEESGMFAEIEQLALDLER